MRVCGELSSHALRMLLQNFCRRVLMARRTEMLCMITLDVFVPRISAEATRRPRMSSIMPTLAGSFASHTSSHGPVGCLRSHWSSGRPETAAIGFAWSPRIPYGTRVAGYYDCEQRGQCERSIVA